MKRREPLQTNHYILNFNQGFPPYSKDMVPNNTGIRHLAKDMGHKSGIPPLVKAIPHHNNKGISHLAKDMGLSH